MIMEKPYVSFTPARMNVDGTPRLLFRDDEMQGRYLASYPKTEQAVGKLCLSMFRDDPDYDYIGVSFTNEEGNEDWTLLFEQYELLTWMGGIAIGRERTHMLHHAERRNGSFKDKYGWAPMLVIEDKVSDAEREYFIDWLMTKDERDGQLFVPEDDN